MELLVEFFENHWLAISFLAPMFWALVNIIDVYFVDGIYRDELDGTIIAGIFQIVPWTFLYFFVDLRFSERINFHTGLDNTFLLSLAGGVLYTLSFYFYFKTLFNNNDVSMLQILWNLTVIVVPLLSFLLFRETMPSFKYFGMAVVLFGATMISFNAKLRSKFSTKYFWTMMGAVLFLSLSMILEERAYGLLDTAYGSHGFWIGFFFFGLGSFTTGLLLSIFFRRSPLPLIKKYYKIFLLGEGVYFLGNLFSQRALSVAPSASLVAAVETFVPVFILVYSLLILFLASYVLKRKNEVIKRIYSEQTGGIWIKIIATIIMAIGVYILS